MYKDVVIIIIIIIKSISVWRQVPFVHGPRLQLDLMARSIAIAAAQQQ